MKPMCEFGFKDKIDLLLKVSTVLRNNGMKDHIADLERKILSCRDYAEAICIADDYVKYNQEYYNGSIE